MEVLIPNFCDLCIWTNFKTWFMISYEKVLIFIQIYSDLAFFKTIFEFLKKVRKWFFAIFGPDFLIKNNHFTYVFWILCGICHMLFWYLAFFGTKTARKSDKNGQEQAISGKKIARKLQQNGEEMARASHARVRLALHARAYTARARPKIKIRAHSGIWSLVARSFSLSPSLFFHWASGIFQFLTGFSFI